MLFRQASRILLRPGEFPAMKRCSPVNQIQPGKRLTAPEDVAQVLVALALCESTWATGNIIRVDGGEDLV